MAKLVGFKGEENICDLWNRMCPVLQRSFKEWKCVSLWLVIESPQVSFKNSPARKLIFWWKVLKGVFSISGEASHFAPPVTQISGYSQQEAGMKPFLTLFLLPRFLCKETWIAATPDSQTVCCCVLLPLQWAFMVIKLCTFYDYY